MDKFSLYVPNFLPCNEYFDPKKNNACPGCGIALALRHVYKAIEGLIEKAAWTTPAGNDLLGGKTGASLLRVKQGKADVIICFDNEAGGTLTDALNKKMPGVAVAEGFKYVATACPSYPFDLIDKMKTAIETEGKSYIHILCPCPAGWKFESENTVKVGFKAVETNAFPLYEVGTGCYTLTIKTAKPKTLSVYVQAQERFAGISDSDLAQANAAVEKAYGKLLESAQPG
ncbi:MAG: hypothetical protein WCQ99_03815 [Pseudomonadota bacterium]